MLSLLFIFLSSIIYVQALVITQPDSTGWPRNVGLMTVRWDTSPSDSSMFTILLRDASQSSVVNPLAVAANILSASGSFELDLPTVPVSQTYQLLFVDTTDLSHVFTASPIFPITNYPNATSSETLTQSTVTVTLTVLPLSSSSSSSIIPSTTSLANSTITSTSFTVSGTSSTSSLSTSASETQFTSSTSTLGTEGTITATVTAIVTATNPGASFVPINAAERPNGMSNWIGSVGIVLGLLYLDEL